MRSRTRSSRARSWSPTSSRIRPPPRAPASSRTGGPAFRAAQQSQIDMTNPPATGQPLVAMRGIAKRFDRVVALDGVDLTLQPGEIHAVVGENGAGKTTLMGILAGVQRSD